MTGSPLSTPPPLADSMIAHQLSHMSMQDQVYLDSHGVREKEMVETPSLVFELMEHMKVQLQQFVLQGRAQAYHQAIQQDTLTKFLQAELMDPSQAALRMVRHFETKRELFGVGKLAKDITQDDLEEDPDGIPTLYTGQSQILCKRDRAGRAISSSTSVESFSCLRRQFYQSQMMAEDEETQKKGMIATYIANNNCNSLENRAHRDSTYT
jgi:hypothetical protein